MKRVAFFDVDGTLYDGNLGFDISKYLVGFKLFSTTIFIRGLLLAIVYKLGILPYDLFGPRGSSLVSEAVSGKHVEKSLGYVEGFYVGRELKLKKKALDLLQELKRQDFLIILVTGEPNFLVRSFVKQIGADGFIASDFEEDNNFVFTGKVLTDLSTSYGKLEAFNKFIEKEDVDLSLSVAVGDSDGDVGILNRVGRAICVDPSRGLLLKAKKNGWEVL